MTGNQCFQIVKKMVATDFEESGLDIYLLGYAMQAGRVTGECPYCHHIVSAKEIEPSKMGWKYMWRYNADA